MRRTRLQLVLLALYFLFIGGTSRYQTLYPFRVSHHIIVTLLLGLWLFQRIRTKKGLPSTPLNLPLFAAIGVWFLTSATSIDPRMAFEHIWFPITFVMFYFVIVDFFQRGRGKLIMETFFLMATLLVFITGLEIASWYFGLGILPGTNIGWFDVGIIIPPHLPQVTLAMGITTLLAGFTVPVIFVTATWAMTVRRTDHRRVLSLLVILLVGVLILTYSRGGLMAFLGGCATFGITRALQHPRLLQRVSRKMIIGAGVVIIIVGILGFVALTLPLGIGNSDEGRLDMWQSAVEMTSDHPLTGVGPGLFGRAFREYRDPIIARDKLASAHNAYLNLASETGIIGIAVGIFLATTLATATLRTWHAAKGKNQRLRVEGMFVALVALGIHSFVDVFTITPINMVLIVIVAYVVTGHRTVIDPIPAGKMPPAIALFGIVIVYGFVQLQWDRAQSLYESSFGRPNSEAITLTKQAQEIDPHLRLYQLHEAYLVGQRTGNIEDIDTAIHDYERVLELEPSWDVGWINLAYLEILRGQPEIALAHLERAIAINPLTSASFQWAALAEEHGFASVDDIKQKYRQALPRYPNLPLADAWWSTDLRHEVSTNYVTRLPVERQYRIWAVRAPEMAQSLIPVEPTTDVDWWIVGHDLLINVGDLIRAEEAFSQAIRLNPSNGDYYVSRALTRLSNKELAMRDLELAELNGTRYEYPKTVWAMLAEDQQSAQQLKAEALPIYSAPQEFSAVLYNRRAVFDIPRDMRFPGLGRSILAPWYEVAYQFIEDGKLENAINAFTFILENAPYETEALEQLSILTETDS